MNPESPTPTPDSPAPDAPPARFLVSLSERPGDGHLAEQLPLVRPLRGGGTWGVGCGACGEPITPRTSAIGPLPCLRCHDVFDRRCHRRMLSRQERRTLKRDGASYALFVCRRCRS